MKTAIIVPARLASSRLHQKLLIEIRGKPLLLWVADRIRGQAPDIPLYFAVDNERFVELLSEAGVEAILTVGEHSCGTDRLAEANRTIQAEQVINVQCDQPLVSGGQIGQLVQMLDEGATMATLGIPLEAYAAVSGRPPDEVFHNPNDVKLIRSNDGCAIYFSRAPIPYYRDSNGVYVAGAGGATPVLIHEGLYAYTAEFLEQFGRLAEGPLEDCEKLEMLRALENGYRIEVGISYDDYLEIDTVEQARDFENYLDRQD